MVGLLFFANAEEEWSGNNGVAGVLVLLRAAAAAEVFPSRKTEVDEGSNDKERRCRCVVGACSNWTPWTLSSSLQWGDQMREWTAALREKVLSGSMGPLDSFDVPQTWTIPSG